MNYIKGFTATCPGIKAEPIIFDNADGSHEYIGWNILLESKENQIEGDLTVIDASDSYTFCNVKTVDTPIKGELLLCFATNLLVNQKVPDALYS
jgi:hypothetical protein